MKTLKYYTKLSLMLLAVIGLTFVFVIEPQQMQFNAENWELSFLAEVCAVMTEQRATKTATTPDQIKSILDWVYVCLVKGLPGGPVAVDVYRDEDVRTIPQNSKQWPMYHDISKQVVWHGEKYGPEDWKDILSADWSRQRIVPGISGGFVALGIRTSKMKKREMAELIELVYAFGAEHGVQWNEPALQCYKQYREAA